MTIPPAVPAWIAAAGPIVAAFLAVVGTRWSVKSNAKAKDADSINAARDSFADDLASELKRSNDVERGLRDHIFTLEGRITAIQDQTEARMRDQDARLRGQDEKLGELTTEVHALRAADGQWRRWLGVVIVLWAEAQEYVFQRGGHLADLPPSPPLT